MSDTIVGHEYNRKILRKSLENNSLSHSYLFEGQDGIGKKKVALEFAKAILCRDEKNRACNNCISCNKVNGFNHPDLRIIKAEDKIIRKDQIDSLIKETTRAPFESKKKIFIIDDSEKMNLESMNALLKTLEEPAEYVVIILITSQANSLLPTILSRVETIKFNAVDIKEVKLYLNSKYNLKSEDLKYISEFTKGSIGKAIELIEMDDFFEIKDKSLNILEKILSGDLSYCFSSMDFFNKEKNNIEEILNIYFFFFRDLLFIKELNNKDILLNIDRLDTLEYFSNMNFNKINDIIEIINDTKTYLLKNINYQLLIEVMLLNIGGL